MLLDESFMDGIMLLGEGIKLVFIVLSGFGWGNVIFFWGLLIFIVIWEVFVDELLLLLLFLDVGDVWMFERFELVKLVVCCVFCLNVCDGSGGVVVFEKFGIFMVWSVVLFVVKIVCWNVEGGGGGIIRFVDEVVMFVEMVWVGNDIEGSVIVCLWCSRNFFLWVVNVEYVVGIG